MKEYKIQDITEIAEAIKSGDPAENDIGTVKDGFFWFPEEMQWAAQWQKDKETDSPDGYFAMLLNPDIFDEEEDEEGVRAANMYKVVYGSRPGKRTHWLCLTSGCV